MQWHQRFTYHRPDAAGIDAPPQVEPERENVKRDRPAASLGIPDSGWRESSPPPIPRVQSRGGARKLHAANVTPTAI